MSAKALVLFSALVVLSGASAVNPLGIPSAVKGEGSSPQRVSILKVVLSCEHLDHKQVSLTGAASIGFENQELCPTPGFLDGDPINCVWLATGDSFTSKQLTRIQKAIDRGTFLLVEGQVSCSNRGFGGLFGAAIEEINLIIEMEKGRVLWTTDPATKAAMEEHERK